MDKIQENQKVQNVRLKEIVSGAEFKPIMQRAIRTSSKNRVKQQGNSLFVGADFSWMEDIQRRNLKSSMARAARHPLKIQDVLSQANLHKSPRKELIQSETEEVTFGNPHRNIRNFDCWEDSQTGEEIVEYYSDKQPPHGKSPIYVNGEYQWSDVRLLDYVDDKFQVEVMATGQVKMINRLSLLLIHEDEKLFHERTQKCKQLQREADEELRFVKYVNSVPNDKVSSLWSCPSWPQHPALLAEVQFEFTLFMKKCYVMQKLSKEEFRLNRLRYRKHRRQKIQPLQICKQDYQKIRNKISQVSYISNKAVQKALLQITSKPKEVFEIVMTQYQLPLTLSNLEVLQQESYQFKKQNMMTLWRAFVLQDIQDTLRNNYNFYQTDLNLYMNSEMQSLIKKIDYLFSTQCENEILLGNISNWVNFIKGFTSGKLHKEPLLILNLVMQPKGKSSQVKRESVVHLEPSREQILAILSNPIRQIQEAINGIHKLEKDLLPLINVDQEQALIVEDQVYQIAISQIESAIDEGLKQPLQIYEQFSQFSFLYQRSTQTIIKKLFGDGKSQQVSHLEAEEIHQKVIFYHETIRKIQLLAVDERNYTFFELRTKQIKSQMSFRAQEILNAILSKLSDLIIENIKRVQEQYADMCERVTQQPRSESSLVDLKNFIAECEVNLAKQQNEVEQMTILLDILDQVSYQFPEREFENLLLLRSWPNEIRMALIEGQRNVNSLELKFTEKLDTEKEIFLRELTAIEILLAQVKELSAFTKEDVNKVMQLKDLVNIATDKLKSFNEREYLFKQPISEYEELSSFKNTFDPHYRLWELCLDFELDKHDWYQGSFLKLNFIQIERKVIQVYLKELSSLSRIFEDENAGEIVRSLRASVEQFRGVLWVIELLTSEPVQRKPYLWRELTDITQMVIEVNEDMSLQLLIDRGIQTHKRIVEDITQRYSLQWQIEKKLNSILEQTKEVKVVVNQYIEEESKLDDLLGELLHIKNSVHAKPIAHKIGSLETKLLQTQDALDKFIQAQNKWINLEYILTTEDVRKKLPNESHSFNHCDRLYRNWMETLRKDPQVMEIDVDRLRQDSIMIISSLENIQRSLTSYLEQKRKVFGRLFSISDQEVLQLMAQGQQLKISTLFDINQLTFNQDILTHVDSIALIKPINTGDMDKKYNPEKWLSELELAIEDTLKSLILQCYNDPRATKEIIKSYPLQCILVCKAIKWNTNCESIMLAQQHPESVSEYTPPSLSYLAQSIDSDIEELLQLKDVKLSPVIIQEIHFRDICRNIGDVKSDSYDWLSQIRMQIDKVVTVNMLNWSISYGYELQNPCTFVITPLTERCRKSLMSAFYSTMIGCLVGAEGKTETIRHLSQTTGYRCIQGSSFKEACSTGAWCCIDIDRVPLQQLSILAQQILVIHAALKAKKKIFYFETDEYILKNCFITLTMTELRPVPSNLKQMFRVSYIYTPDIQMIAEVTLLSKGLNPEIGSKILQILKNCKQFINYNLRTVKLIIDQISEENNAICALKTVIGSSLNQVDQVFFDKIISDIFQETQIVNVSLAQMIALRSAIVVGLAGCGKSTEIRKIPISKCWIYSKAVDSVKQQISNADQKDLLIVDGPMESIEQYNSIIDKRRIIFEVDNLINASPATVSRCGIYSMVEQDWVNIVDNFIAETQFPIRQKAIWLFDAIQSLTNVNVHNALRIFQSFAPFDAEEIDNLLLFSILSATHGSWNILRSVNATLQQLLAAADLPLKTRFVLQPQALKIRYLDTQKDLFKLRYDREKKGWLSFEDRIQYFLQKSIEFKESVLFIGSHFEISQLTFSAASRQIQQRIEPHISHRRRKNHYGPIQNLVIHIEDLHLAELPTLELIRQFQDQKGWCESKSQEFRYIDDCLLIASSQQGIKQSRLTRHFHIIELHDADIDLNKIFTAIIAPLHTKVANKLIQMTLDLYQQAQNLKPTPNRLQFTIEQPINLLKSLTKTQYETDEQLLQSWNFHAQRVFCDRLKREDRIFLDSSNLLMPIAGTFKLNTLEQITELISIDPNVVLYKEFIINLVSVLRGLVMGHVVIVGRYGSGRRTLAKLAIKIAYDEVQTSLAKCIQQNLRAFITEDLQLAEDIMQGYLPLQDDGEYELSNLHLIVIAKDMNFRRFPKLTTANIIIIEQLTQESLLEISSKFIDSEYSQMAVECFDDKSSNGHFIQMMRQFVRIHEKHSNQIRILIERYTNGVAKMMTTESDLHLMKDQLQQIQPKLQRSSLQCSHMLINLQKKQKEADTQRSVCEKEEQSCSFQAMHLDNLKLEINRDLAQIQQQIQQSTVEIDKLTQEDILQLKNLVKPPGNLVKILEALSLLLDGQLKDQSKRQILNDKLLKRIKAFKDDAIKAITPNKVQQIKALLQNDDQGLSKTAVTVGQWIKIIIEINNNYVIIEPKNIKCQSMQSELKQQQDLLLNKRTQLAQLLQFIQSLETEYQQAKQEKQALEVETDRLSHFLDRAERLIHALAADKDHWKSQANQLRSQNTIVPDSIMASAIITLTGNLTREERQIYIKKFTHRVGNFSLNQICESLISDDILLIIQENERHCILLDPHQQYQGKFNNYSDAQSASQNGECVRIRIDDKIPQEYHEIILSNDNHPNFKCIFISQGELHLPDWCYSHMNIVNGRLSEDSIDQIIMSAMMKLEEPAKEEQRIRILKDIQDQKVKYTQTQDQILSLLCHHLDDEAISILQRLKIELMEGEERIKKMTSEIKSRDHQDAGKGFKAIERLQQLCPLYKWSLEYFISILPKHKSDHDQHVYQTFAAQIQDKHKIILALQLLLSKEDFQLLASNTEEESQIHFLTARQYYIFKKLGINISEIWQQYMKQSDIRDTPIPMTNEKKLILISVTHKAQFAEAARKFIEERYIFKKPSLSEFINETKQPIILSGNDPKSTLQSLKSNLIIITLGYGQNLDAILKALNDGKWILVQNCHLADTIVLQQLFDEHIHEFSGLFRLFLSTEPKAIPIPILHQCVKYVLETNTIKDHFNNYDENKPYDTRRKLFSISLLHALLQHRNKYQFIQDFELNNQFDSVLEFEIQGIRNWAQIVFQGKDEQSQRIIDRMINEVLQDDIILESFEFKGLSLNDTTQFLQDLKQDSSLVGLPYTADLHLGNRVSLDLLTQIEKVLNQKIESPKLNLNEILTKLSSFEVFDMENVQTLYPIEYSNPMNHFLQSEIRQYNRLISYIVSQAQEINHSLQTHGFLAEEYLAFAQSLLNNHIPWSNVQISMQQISYPCTDNLTDYLIDLDLRINQLQDWIQKGQPVSMRLIFFSIVGLENALRIKYARKNQISIDLVSIIYQSEQNEDSIGIEGLHLDQDLILYMTPVADIQQYILCPLYYRNGKLIHNLLIAPHPLIQQDSILVFF